MLRPIPRSVLSSSVVVREPIEGDYGGAYGEPKTISNVRFIPSSRIVRGDIVLSDGVKGVLFIDAVNSAGAFDIPVGSLLSIDGAEDASAGKVDRFEGFAGVVHHWEIEVI